MLQYVVGFIAFVLSLIGFFIQGIIDHNIFYIIGTAIPLVIFMWIILDFLLKGKDSKVIIKGIIRDGLKKDDEWTYERGDIYYRIVVCLLELSIPALIFHDLFSN